MLKKLVCLVLLLATHAWGQVEPPAVSASQVDTAIERVTSTLPEGDPQREARLKLYADTHVALSNYLDFAAAREQYYQARTQAVSEAEKIMANLGTHADIPDMDADTLKTLSLAELERTIQVTKTELDSRKSQLAEVRKTIDAMPQRPTQIRTRLAELAELSAALQAQLELASEQVTAGSSEEAKLWLARAQFASVQAEKASLEEEMLSQPMRLELARAHLDQYLFEIAALEKRLRTMTNRATALRQGEAADARAAADLVLAGAQNKHRIIRQLADRNAELTRTFSQVNDGIQKTDREEEVVRGHAEQLEQDLISIERKLDLLGMSSAVGVLLRERQAQLPERQKLQQQIEANANAVRSSSLRQVELEDERRQLRDPKAYVDALLDGVSASVASEIREDLFELVNTRRDLIRTAVDLENTFAQGLGDLDFILRRYAVAVDDYRAFVSERLLWIPSRDTFSVLQSGEIMKQFQSAFAPMRWLTLVRNLPALMWAQPLLVLSLAVVIALIYISPRLKRGLAEAGEHVGYVRSDRFFFTVQALFISVVLSVKWPLLLLTMGKLIEMHDSESELASAVSVSAVRTSVYFWGLEFLRMALLPKGLVDRHFGWPASRVSTIAKHFTTLELTLLPASFLVGVFLKLSPREVGGPLGALCVMLVLASMAYFFYRLPAFIQSKMQMMFRDGHASENPFWAKIIRRLLIWIPLLAIVAVLFGYTYTAIEIALLLVQTFVLLSCVLILHELGLRWLAVTRRRMALRMRHEHAKSSSDETDIKVEEEILENDPALLNDEGTKLLNLLTLFGGILGVGLIWAAVIPALGVLDSVTLWHQTAVLDGREVATPVTLTDLFAAFIFAIVGWVIVSRVPSLLEIFLRQKVAVHPASAYAITRVVQYAFTAVLIVIVVSSLGGSWSSMQWAVAALSLGIGFGLQEIVANFVSGLIILFEQPIRLGDTVTVGEVSGTVTRIQMRATTIRDFDRRELLVPNKEFITSQLLNWSLSDTVTRRIITVGVAYGTDMDKALEIVEDVARKHPRILADPESSITFDDFGDSSLLISLRYFIGNVEQLLKTGSELRLEINRRFIEAGIEVSFPQRDVHLDTSQPLEIRMIDKEQSETGTPG